MNKSESSNKQIIKFLSLMNMLTKHIREDVHHQTDIFNYLNSDQQKKLFSSLEQNQPQIRITAMVFILYLMYQNQTAIEQILKRDNFDIATGITKYIIGGLNKYSLSPKELIIILKLIKQLKYQPNVLCWSINLKTYKISYLPFKKSVNQEFITNLKLYNFQVIDPYQNIIGIFVKCTDSQQKFKIGSLSSSMILSNSTSRKSITNAKNGKYTIGKK